MTDYTISILSARRALNLFRELTIVKTDLTPVALSLILYFSFIQYFYACSVYDKVEPFAGSELDEIKMKPEATAIVRFVPACSWCSADWTTVLGLGVKKKRANQLEPQCTFYVVWMCYVAFTKYALDISSCCLIVKFMAWCVIVKWWVLGSICVV